ncbi:MAG: family 43 glycosylhydrolase, partial [Kiritimatiellae bacterium]|nr:family 43 glycosylhydrolase [Kiritimatiellia bacterium]
MKQPHILALFLAATLSLSATETALVRARWSGFVTTDKVERVMANAYVTAKPLGDAQAIPLHDAGKTIVYDWETGDADDLLAAVGVGAEYVRTSRPLEARAIIGADAAKGKTAPVAADAFRIRDPFILADDATKTYYLYETTDPYTGRPYARGVSVRTSKDLRLWSRPQPVMSVPPKDHCRTVWAPEVCKIGARYLMFATLSVYPDREGARGPNAARHECRRGTWISESAAPTGPFRPVTG